MTPQTDETEQYIAPAIEVIRLELQGFIAQSNIGDFPDGGDIFDF